MNQIVLDTHLLVWLANGDKLPAHLQKITSSKNSKLYISSISAWEIFMLVKKGFIVLDRPAYQWIEDALTEFNIQCIDINPMISCTAVDLDWNHKDPADRFIVATTSFLGGKLATCDKEIIKSKIVDLVA